MLVDGHDQLAASDGLVLRVNPSWKNCSPSDDQRTAAGASRSSSAARTFERARWRGFAGCPSIVEGSLTARCSSLRRS